LDTTGTGTATGFGEATAFVFIVTTGVAPGVYL